MISKYKCNFCGAPRLSTEIVCKFCGQKISDENNSSIVKSFKNSFNYLKNKEKIIKRFKKTINFSFISQIGSKFSENFLDSYKRTSSILIKSGKNVSKLVSNNSKPILFSFLGLSSLIISTKLVTYYFSEQYALKNKKEKREYIQIAESKLQENDLNGAIKAYLKSIEIPSSYKSSLEDRNAYKGIAKIKLKQKKYDDASEYFSKIIDNIRWRHLSNWGLKSDKVELYYNRGLSNYYSKKYEYSKKHQLVSDDLTLALNLSKMEGEGGIPENISNFHLNLFYMRGDSYVKKNNGAWAMDDINKVISKDKNPKPEYYQIRSRANYLQEKYEDAISDATTSLELIKNDPQLKSISYIIRAESHRAKNNYKLSCLDLDKALIARGKKFDQSLEIEDINIPEYRRESYAYYQAYKSNTKYQPKLNYSFYKKNCFIKHENIADPWSPLRAGKAYDLKVFYKDSTFEKNDPEKEEYLLKRIDKIFKSSLDEKKCKQSYELLNSLIKVSQNSDGYFYRGRTKYLCNADFEGAFKDLNKAISIQPNNSDYFYFRGIANYLYRNNKEAINDFKKAINLDSSKHYYYYLLGITYYDLKEYKNSKTQLTNSLSLNNYSFRGSTGNTYNFTWTYRGLLNRARNKRHLKQYLSGINDLNLLIKKSSKEDVYPHQAYIEKGNIQFLLDDTQSACRSWNQGKIKDWENQFKLEDLENDSLYNIYKEFCN